MVIPQEGQKYKHRQIKDTVYTVVGVDPKAGKVALEGFRVGEWVNVTFAQLQANYKRV